MNRKMVFYLLGKILIIEAVLLGLPLICSVVYNEAKSVYSFAVTMVISFLLGLLLINLFKPKDKTIFAREGFVIVALAWIVMSLIGALPFTISGEIPHYVDAVFETVSGFTTTGASILTDVESMSHGCLFWRSFTHWVGGMGILVLVLAIVPTESGRSMHIARAEMPGPIIGKLVPKMKSTAKILYLIYIFITLLEVVFLLFGGMNLFESLVHSLGTAGTGGFGIKADSIASYSPYIQWVIAIFMLVFGVNFNLYYLIILGKIKNVFKSEELWVYISIVLGSITLIAINIYKLFGSFSETLRYSAFQVSSVITTTGYSTANFNEWPNLSKGILFLLMFIGGCAGSTAGGLKISRAILLSKRLFANLRHSIHPRSTELIRFEGKKVETETSTGVLTYFALYCLCLVCTFFLLLFEPFDLETNITAAVSCFNNIGPAFSSAWDGFSIYSSFSKIVLSFAMLLGRLEIYPLILLFTPLSWVKRRKLKS